MTPEQEVRRYKQAKFAKKAVKTVVAQGVKLGGGVVGGINPVSAFTNVRALTSTGEHVRAIEKLYDEARLNHLTFKSDIFETLQYVLAQKRAKRRRYKQNMVPIVSGLVGIRSALHYMHKKSIGEQGEERRVHARRLWRYAKGKQLTSATANKREETRLAIAVISELVGPERVDWVLRTEAGFNTVIFDKLAKT